MGREEVQIEHTRQFQSYKADLDAFFGSVLEEEEVSEEARRTAELMNYEDEQERGMILRAIAEDRARASLRIKRIADENAAKLRAAMKHLVLEEADGMSWSLS